ncbi:MAG: O-antigen ligase family protein [Pirellulales bacterium]
MNASPPRRTDPFVLLAGVLLFGYLLMSRTFAHWGIGPLYVGEMALAAYLVARPASLAEPWLRSLAVPTRLSTFSWWLTISLAYGAFECVRGLIMGSPLLVGEIAVIHLYPLYVLPGLWVGRRHPNVLSRLIPILAWCHGVYGLAFITVFAPLGLSQSLEDPSVVGWLGHPAGSSILLLGLLAFQRNLWRGSIPMLLNILVMIGMQRRAEWVAFIAAVMLWAYLAGRVKQLVYFAGLLVCVLLLGLLPDFEFPSPGFRGESMSTYDLVSRLLAPIDPDAAADLSPDADAYAATATWRSDYWGAVWNEVHATEERAVFGLGYHYPLWQLHPFHNMEENPARTPHSIFVFVLGYSGWLGVLIFVGLQGALARLLWRTYRETGEPFGICLWTLAMVWAIFDPLLERPVGAIPLYLLMGMAAAQTITRDAFLHSRTASRIGHPRGSTNGAEPGTGSP